MIDSILGELAKTAFDFRAYANPSDPLSPLFEEWVAYYRLKFAIVKALQPKSILEVGVRFGYSARAFLEASPAAKLLGIDLDCDLYGGQKGALEWARPALVHGKLQVMPRAVSVRLAIDIAGQLSALSSPHLLSLAGISARARLSSRRSVMSDVAIRIR
jgi:hypothetical protein